MNRRTYIYSLVPALMVLNSGATISKVCGNTTALIIGAVVAVMCWALVWMRLYSGRSTKRLRPEFSILAVVPQLSFYLLNMTDEITRAPFADDFWQNLYFILWIASVLIVILSLKPTAEEQKELKASRDAIHIIVCAFLILSALMGWSACSGHLFPSLLNT